MSVKEVVCVFECACNSVCACTGETERERELLCICLPAMPLPAPDVPASQRLALECSTLLDHRVGKGE